MSFLSSIFGTGTGIAHNGPQPPAPAAPPQAAAPAPAAAPAVPPAPVSPLDQFTKMWDTPLTSDGKPAPMPVDPLRAPIVNFDPTKITESANKMDFASSVNPELVAKALSGDTAAFSDVINQAIRNAVVGMTLSNGQLLNNAINTNNERITSQLPTHIKQVQLRESTEENSVFNHPAAQPLVQSLKQLAFAKDPNASVADINDQISKYLTGFAAAVVDAQPQNVQQRQQTAAAETDWMKYGGLS